MTGYLVDTSVTSLFAPRRQTTGQALANWMLANNAKLHLSTVTVLEAEQGIAKLHRQRAHQRADEIEVWLDALIMSFDPRVIDIDREIARTAGRLADKAIEIGRHPGLADILIAATSQAHNFTLLTRNTKHFTPLGIDVVDPLVSLPE